MVHVPYLYINFLALFSYIILFAAFLTAKRTAENRAFMFVLAAFILWAAGSIFMRLQLYPGISFWFYVSLLSLFSVVVPLYFFVCSYTGAARTKQSYFWIAGTAAILVATAFGAFLQPPTVQTLPTGGAVFLYNVKWPILIPCAFFAGILLSMARMLAPLLRHQHARAPGFWSLILGLCAVAAGNILQILPGNVFPYDTLGGIVFALCITYTLLRQHMFHIELLISPNVLVVVCMGAFLAFVLYLAPTLEASVRQFTGVQAPAVSSLTILLIVLSTWVVYLFLRLLFRSISSREKRQHNTLNQFSQMVSKSLDTSEIVQCLTDLILAEVAVPAAGVFLEDQGRYVPYAAQAADGAAAFTFTADSISILQLQSGSTHVFTDDFSLLPTFWEPEQEEKAYLDSLDVNLLLALKVADDILGLVLLPGKGSKRTYTAAELDFLDTAANIAAIAIQNATLYEQLYREARIDHLTGLFNYNYFITQLDALTKVTPPAPLALLYLDVDDMRLYNQLYGTARGDDALRRIAAATQELTAGRGMAFRYSGKVFAVLLPGYTLPEAQTFAARLQQHTSALSGPVVDGSAKPLSMSVGICTYPDAAKNARELMEYADIAVFNAKSSGKGTIEVFETLDPSPHRVTEKVLHIISHSERQGPEYFSSYSATILALTAAIDAKDHYTYSHSQNVAYYASMLAAAAGLTNAQVRIVYEAALLHDIGKISIPESILRKQGALMPEERAVMNTHVLNSIEIIRHLPSMDYVVPVAIAHHERWDGHGYPRGISGGEIPVGARCLAIADSFDAMLSSRPYRDQCSLGYALQEVAANAGTQFDPDIANVFLSLMQSKEIIVR